MKNPFVTVLLPVYNAEKFLRRSIESILGQTYLNFELLIINDGSTDYSEEIIKSFGDRRIRYLKNSSNLKLIKTLNLGIELAKGEFVVRMDADDEALPERIERQVAFMMKNPRLAASGTFAYRVSVGGKQENWRYPTTNSEMKCRLFWGNSIIHPTAIIRRSIIDKIKYKEGYEHAEDYKLWTELITMYELANLPEYLLIYYEHKGQITNTKYQKMNDTKFKINREWLGELNLSLPNELEHIYRKFLEYEYREWTNQEIKSLISFLDEIVISNSQEKVFDVELFANQVSERLQFVIFNTVREAPKGIWEYRRSRFSSINALSARAYFKWASKYILG